MQDESRLTRTQVVLWILVLSFVSVGLKNFEEGLSIDAPLYTSIARNIVRTGEWFRLDGNVPDFQPYYEHPHLGFWWLALTFKILPIADWSARVPGHLFYIGFLWIFFSLVRWYSGEKVAVGSVLLLWIWYRFSNFFSNAYLDPSALFFGTVAVYFLAVETDFSLLAGASVALCFLSKGLVVLGFLPVVVYCLIKNRKHKGWFQFVVGLLLILGPYFYFLSRSSVPDFFSHYWANQVSSRFGKTADWRLLFGLLFWKNIAVDTLFLAPLALLAFRKNRARWEIPTILFVSFWLLFAPNGRQGIQYDLMLLPWLAWMISEGGATRMSFTPLQAARVTSILCIVIVFLVQYSSVRIHAGGPPNEISEIKILRRDFGVETLVLDVPNPNFIVSSPLAWYADVRIEYSPIKDPHNGTAYLLRGTDIEKEKSLSAQGFCLFHRYDGETLWFKGDRPCLSEYQKLRE